MAKVADGVLKEWLSAHRTDLNTRFRKAQRRYARLNPDNVLNLVAEILPPLADPESAATPALLSAMYDLILLQAGRELLRVDAGASRTGVGVLYREVFPAIRPCLLQRPQSLPASLSNAVENMKERGAAYCQRLIALAPLVSSVAELLDAGVVAAWRSGEPRLRLRALEIARVLPPKISLAALDLASWPEASVPALLKSFARNAWFTPPPPKTRKTVVFTNAWIPIATVGDFAGFGGVFEEPPLMLAAGAQMTPHRFWVRSGDRNWRVEADVFGSVCASDPSADFPVQAVQAAPSGLAKVWKALSGNDDGSPKLTPDGTLQIGGESESIADLAGAASFAWREGLIAYTTPDSFRIRILLRDSEAT
jgi:hypothetical protein